jgi:hypothetical protein
LIKQAGFEDQEFVGISGYKSSPVTTGALFRARKKVQLAFLTKVRGSETSEEQKETSIPEEETCSTSS